MYRITSFSILVLFSLSGCGPSGDSQQDDIGNNSQLSLSGDKNENAENKIILVERGPVFKGTLSDANGNKAYNLNLGLSNQYQFLKKITYPLKISKGYMDINRDGKIDESDAKLDIEMLSYYDVVSPLTTILENNDSVVELLSSYLPITKKDIINKVPSKTSINAIVLSNAVYGALKKGYKVGTTEFSDAVNDIISIYHEKFTNIKDLKNLSILLEKEIVTEPIPAKELVGIKNENPTPSSTPTPSSIPKEEITETTVKNLDFKRTNLTTDNIQDIWNISLNIAKNSSVKNFDIGVTFVKSSSKTKGVIAIRDINIENGKITSIGSLSIWGRKVSGSESSVKYLSAHELTKKSLSSGDGYLLINLGYIMENQEIVSPSSFTQVASYDIGVYSNKLKIGATVLNSETLLQITVSDQYLLPVGTEMIRGQIEIKEK